jgi:anti-anti-sigma regulatory factor
MYPILATSSAINLVGRASRHSHRHDMIYVDSATIGCLMDTYRQVSAAGGHLKLCGVQKRVETMLKLTGSHNFIEMHADEPAALESFGA